MEPVLGAALAAHEAGLCPIRPRTDGTKAPMAVPHHGPADPATGKRGPGWELYQSERPSPQTVAGWFRDHPGLGIVCGAVSGHLQMLELEGRMMTDAGRCRRLLAALDAHGARDTWNRMTAGYRESTPSGGVHTMAHVPGYVAGNVVLARCPTDGGPRPLIETRGDGGFTVVAPSNGTTHPTGGSWVLRSGGFDSIATVTVEEWEAVLAAAMECNEVASAEPTTPAARRLTVPEPWAGGTVGGSWMDVAADHLEATGGVLEILLRHGWRRCRDAPEMIYVTRPGDDKAGGVSAQIKRENGRLLNYSSSVTEFEAWPTFRGNPPRQVPTTSYDAADVLAVYEFDGDREAALRAVAEAAGIHAAWLVERDPLAGVEMRGGKIDVDQPDDDKLPRRLDWAAFANRDEETRQWLVEGFWPWGRAMALWAAAKTGKSELALWCAAKLALGEHPWTSAPAAPVDVAYFDFEMTEDDLDDRLAAFNFDPTRLARLHYFLLPALHALDIEKGGIEVEALVSRAGAQAVVFDTFGRAVRGEENEADTVRDFYRFTGARLKRAGVGYLRTDHAGKDATRGQRGSSAKRDDVDVVWSMTRPKAGGALLSCEGSSRLSWVGPRLKVERVEVGGVVSYSAPVRIGWSAGVAEKVKELDALRLSPDLKRADVQRAFWAAGKVPGRTTLLAEAQRFRREIAAREHKGNTSQAEDGNQGGN